MPKRVPRTPQVAKCDPKRYPKAMNIKSNRCSILIKDSNRAANCTRPGGLREALSINTNPIYAWKQVGLYILLRCLKWGMESTMEHVSN